MRGGQGWTQCRVAVQVEVVAFAGVAWFAGDEEAQRKSFGWRRFRPFPIATERGNRGEKISLLHRFHIERKERRG